MSDIEELRALLAAAEPGMFVLGPHDSQDDWLEVPGQEGRLARAAVNALPALLDLAEQAAAAIDAFDRQGSESALWVLHMDLRRALKALREPR